MASYRFAVSVMPKPGILDPQGRAVEQSLPHLGVDTVHGVRVGRRVELTVEAGSEPEARVVVERLAAELFANPLIERWSVEPVAGASSARSDAPGGDAAPEGVAASPAPGVPARETPGGPARDAAGRDPGGSATDGRVGNLARGPVRR